MNYAASTFVANTSNGNQAVTGLGFQPMALRIVAVKRSAVGVGNPGNISIGMTDGTNVRCQFAAYDDNVSTTNTYGGVNTTDIVHLLTDGTPTTDSIATFVSFDSGGFTINWSTAPATAWLIFYEAWGGLTNVAVGTWAPSGTGSKSLTGLAFQPDVLFWVIGKTAAVDSQIAVGATSGSGTDYGDSCYSGDNLTSGSITRAYHKAASILCLTGGGGIAAEATLTSFNSDGWTYNFTTNSVSAGQIFYYMAIKGGRWKVGVETSQTGVAPQSKQTSGIAFQPLAVSFFGAYLAASSSVVTGNGQIGFGAATAVSTGKGLGVQWGNASTFRSSQGLNSDPVYLPNATGGAAGLVADMTAWDSDSFTLTYSTTAATNREFGYVAFASVSTSQAMTATTATATASLTRSVGKSLTATTATATASIVRSVGKTVSATATSTATVVRSIAKTLSATTATATASITRSVGKIVSAAATCTASATRSCGKTLTATTATATASITRSVGKTLAASASATAAIVKQAATTLSATCSSTASLVKSVGKPVTATCTSSASLVRSVAKTLTATVSSTASILASAVVSAVAVRAHAAAAAIGKAIGRPGSREKYTTITGQTGKADATVDTDEDVLP